MRHFKGDFHLSELNLGKKGKTWSNAHWLQPCFLEPYITKVASCSTIGATRSKCSNRNTLSQSLSFIVLFASVLFVYLMSSLLIFEIKINIFDKSLNRKLIWNHQEVGVSVRPDSEQSCYLLINKQRVWIYVVWQVLRLDLYVSVCVFPKKSLKWIKFWGIHFDS